MRWACEDLNLGPLPYQQYAGNRRSEGRFCRSRATVGAKLSVLSPCSYALSQCVFRPTDAMLVITSDSTAHPALHTRPWQSRDCPVRTTDALAPVSGSRQLACGVARARQETNSDISLLAGALGAGR